MTRLNRILIGLLVVQLIVGALVFLPRTLSSEVTVETLVPGLESGEIVRLAITAGDGRSIRLAKSGEGWVLPDSGDYPVLADKVLELLNKIVALQTAPLVTETPGSHKRLKVDADEFERLVEVATDSQTYRFYVGSSPSFGAAHVRVDGQDEVYLTAELSAGDAGTSATDWVDTTYFTLPPDDVRAFTLQNPQGTFEFAKEGDAWTMVGLAEGELLDDTEVETLLNRATTIRLQKPLGKDEEPDYGLDNPTAIVTLETAEETHALRVGAQDFEDSSYIVAWSGSPFIVRVSEFSVQDLVETTREDLLQQPTPEVTPGG